jgi:hypothetical protein
MTDAMTSVCSSAFRPIAPPACLLGLLLTVAGCGRHAGPDVQMVTGVVLMNGQPVDGAHVSFHPMSGGIAASGMTARDGSFRLTSDRGGRPNAGAIVGDYAVTVVKWRNDSPPLPEDPGPGLSDADYAKWKREYDSALAAQKPAVSALPEKYRVPEKSGLEASVGKGANRFRFELAPE